MIKERNTSAYLFLSMAYSKEIKCYDYGIGKNDFGIRRKILTCFTFSAKKTI